MGTHGNDQCRHQQKEWQHVRGFKLLYSRLICLGDRIFWTWCRTNTQTMSSSTFSTSLTQHSAKFAFNSFLLTCILSVAPSTVNVSPCWLNECREVGPGTPSDRVWLPSRLSPASDQAWTTLETTWTWIKHPETPAMATFTTPRRNFDQTASFKGRHNRTLNLFISLVM